MDKNKNGARREGEDLISTLAPTNDKELAHTLDTVYGEDLVIALKAKYGGELPLHVRIQARELLVKDIRGMCVRCNRLLAGYFGFLSPFSGENDINLKKEELC